MSASRSRRLGALLAVIALGGCATNPAPVGWLPRAEQLPRSARGAWIVLNADMGRGGTGGELIAVGEDRVFILTEAGLRSIPRSDVRHGTLALYETNAGKTAAASLITLTHGRFLLLTAPMWFALAIGESREPLLPVRQESLDSIRKYARFPQGLPPDLDPASLGPL